MRDERGHEITDDTVVVYAGRDRSGHRHEILKYGKVMSYDDIEGTVTIESQTNVRRKLVTVAASKVLVLP